MRGATLVVDVLRLIRVPFRTPIHERHRRFARARAIRRAAAVHATGTVIEHVLDADHDPIIAHGRGPTGTSVTGRLARTSASIGRLRAHLDAVDAFGADGRAPVPRLLATRETSTSLFAVETRLPGRPVSSRADLPEDLAMRCFDALAMLHGAGTRLDSIDDHLLANWVDDHIEVISAHQIVPIARDALERIRLELRASLDRPMIVTRSHGDFTPGNVLVREDGSVAGIIDFEHSTYPAPPDTDYFQFVLMTVAGRIPVGEIVCTTLRTGRPHPAIERVASLAIERIPNRLDLRTVVLHAWLLNVTHDLRKFGVENGPKWAQQDIADVIRQAGATRA